MHAIDTARLRLRPMDACDEALYVALYSDVATMRFIAAPLPRPVARRSFRQASRAACAAPERFVAIVDAADGRGIGLCGLILPTAHPGPAEFGIVLSAGARGLGVAAEASIALIGFAFDALPIDAVRVHYHPANAAAARLFERIGLLPVQGAPPPAHRVRAVGRDDWFHRAAHNRGE